MNRYFFKPQPDITALELAEILSRVHNINCMKEDGLLVEENKQEEFDNSIIRRHFVKYEFQE